MGVAAWAVMGCGSASPGGGGVCSAGETLCGDICVDTDANSLHCGDCNAACTLADPLCETGGCVTACTIGRVECGGACIDMAGDNNNCGGCGIECGLTETCQAGRCVPDGCQGAMCGDACVDLATDPLHCGECDSACTATNEPYCAGGVCQASCPAGTQDCGNGTCTSTDRDAANCGVCGNACNSDSACVGGSCACADPTAVNCGAYCATVADDPLNCGECENECGSGTCISGGCSCTSPTELDCGGGGCEDITLNPDQCGACAVQCDPDEYCVDSGCDCRPGLVRDGADCIDPTIDPAACGPDAVVCAGGTPLCGDGECVDACGGGLQMCGMSCANTESNVFHCGECDNDCKADELCVGSECRDFGAVPECDACPCDACDTSEVCCPYPGDPSVILCVDDIDMCG